MYFFLGEASFTLPFLNLAHTFYWRQPDDIRLIFIAALRAVNVQGKYTAIKKNE